MGTLASRIGGAFGILSVLVMIPAFLVGSPDKPHTPDQARHYYESGSAFVTVNGDVPLLHTWIGLPAAISTLAAKTTTPSAIESRAAGNASGSES